MCSLLDIVDSSHEGQHLIEVEHDSVASFSWRELFLDVVLF